MVKKKLSLEKSKLYKKCMGSLTFLPPNNFAVFDDCYFLCYHLQRTQIVQINQLSQLLNLFCAYGDVFYRLTRMLMCKNVNNDVSKDSPEEAIVGCTISLPVQH